MHLVKGCPISAPDRFSSPEHSAEGRLIEISLRDERYRDWALTFKPPARDTLAASANRLLKFEFPPVRNLKVYERLIKTNGSAAGLSKKMLESLPLPAIEQIYRELWPPLAARLQAENDWLALFVLLEELSEFDAAYWVLRDIQTLGVRDPGAMHSYYYQGALDREQMAAFLAGHGYRTDFLDALPPVADEPDAASLALAYLACRKLTFTLPWAALLDGLAGTELEKYPRLARLQGVRDLIRSQAWTAAALLPTTLASATERLSTLRERPEFTALAVRYQLPRPVRALLIVEGETEKLLLPLFAQAMGVDLNAAGVDILPAGGKNQVSAIYRENSRCWRAPIGVLLDSDARAVAEELKTCLRPQDAVMEIAEGEFEDLYDLDWTLQTINRCYQPFPEVTRARFAKLARESQAKGRVQTLKALWQAYNLGAFDKIEFAQKYAEAFQPLPGGEMEAPALSPPPAICEIVECLLALREQCAAGTGKPPFSPS